MRRRFAARAGSPKTAAACPPTSDACSNWLRRSRRKRAHAARQCAPRSSLVGNATVGSGLSVNEFLSSLGEITLAFGKFVRGKARYRKINLLEVIQECGPNAVGSSP